MSRDYFAILGLSPGRYSPEEVTRRFLLERARVLPALGGMDRYNETRRRLDELHLAHALLSDPNKQAALLSPEEDEAARLRDLIAASLEEGLLRYSRRQEILETARRLGYSDFQAQLMIAQVQFGDRDVRLGRPYHAMARRGPSRFGLRLAAVGVLATALFLAMVRWLT